MRREYKGAAASSVLVEVLGGSVSDLEIFCNDLTNWPTGLGGKPFFVVVDRGKLNEEKILCSSRTGNVITVYADGITNGRGADDTSISAHSVNAVIEHTFTALDADEANAHVNATAGVHGLTGSVVGDTDTQALENKTIDFDKNTLLNLPIPTQTDPIPDIFMLGGM